MESYSWITEADFVAACDPFESSEELETLPLPDVWKEARITEINAAELLTAMSEKVASKPFRSAFWCRARMCY